MTMKPILRAEGLGKCYRIGAQRAAYRTLREALSDAAAAPLSWLRRVGRAPDSTVWALRDVSFEVVPSEVVGIVGGNGAGKSTLLKILSRITRPTEGQARLSGRVGSLLEVGTGFHPELTGRENVFLNGAILGMSRRAIRAHFDAIVAFAEVSQFLDTPVKRYSSGMYTRLAFAVAAHLEPEILLVDEVLAVGDAAFQKKCLAKMSQVASQGRTVLFISHNMGAVGRLCHRGIVLEKGRLVFSGGVTEAIERYTASALSTAAKVTYPPDPSKKIVIREASLLDATGHPSTDLDRARPFRVCIEYQVQAPVSGAHVALMLDRMDGTPIWHAADVDSHLEGGCDREPGCYRTVIEFPGVLLNAGAYQIRLGVGHYGGVVYDYREPFVFQLHDHGTHAALGVGGAQRPGVLAMPLDWQTERLPARQG
jgi:lipopolysaccharide transport system ATP-binding protein